MLSIRPGSAVRPANSTMHNGSFTNCSLETTNVKLCKVRDASGAVRMGCLQDDGIALFDASHSRLSDILHSGNPAASAQACQRASQTKCKLGDGSLLSPADGQEIWAAGVTYKR